MPVTITGTSDDLIEVDGDVREEFNVPTTPEGGHLLAFSDGTVLRVRLTDDGVWRIATVHHGSATLAITQAPEDDPDNYSDRATLTGPVCEPIEWVVLGTEVATHKRDAHETASPPWQGVAVTVAACRVLPDGRMQEWRPHPTVLEPDRVHQVMKTALALGKCRPTPIPGDVYTISNIGGFDTSDIIEALDTGDIYAILNMVDAEGDVIGGYAIPDRNALEWWIDTVDLQIASTDGDPS